MKKITVSIISIAILATSCVPASTGDDDRLKVLASTSFLADIAQNIAGDRLQVDSLLPFGADPHAYQSAPADVTRITKSTLLILNGIEYEHFIEPLLENADGERLLIVASDGLEAHHMDERQGEGHAAEAGSSEGYEHEAGDPHMWLDPNLVITYVENIRDGLIAVDPEGAAKYSANADLYIARLKELDAWIVEQVNTIPAERRLLITNHEALGYFADRYGFEIVDTILPSFSSEASASAWEIAAAVEAVKSSGAPVIFLDEVENADLADQIAAETAVKIVDDLHLESLTDGPPAGTYIDMMKHNVSRIVESLK
jgi:ABC-type Zn uptake system ZnuABC Zn-binding protein ZnuA